MGAKMKARRAYRKQYSMAKLNKKWADKIRAEGGDDQSIRQTLSQSQQVQTDQSPYQSQDQGYDQGGGQDMYGDQGQYSDQAWEYMDYADYADYADKKRFSPEELGAYASTLGGIAKGFGFGGGEDADYIDYMDYADEHAHGANGGMSTAAHDSIHHPINKLLIAIAVGVIVYIIIEKL